MRALVFRRKHSQMRGTLLSCRTYKARHRDTVQKTLYRLFQNNGQTIELSGDQLHADWIQEQPQPRRPKHPRRYTSTRGQRRREQLGRKP